MSTKYTKPSPVAPTTIKDDGPMGGTVAAHPAYGMMSFNRVSGDPGKLFGSEISHNGFIRFELHPAEDHRSLSRNWYHARNKTFCEVDLSYAQFTELITSMNMGSGVPCTIRYVDDETGMRPEIVDKSTLHETIKSEIRAEAQDAIKDAIALEKQLSETLAKSGLSKVKQKELTDLASRLTSSIKSSLPFIVDSYQEAAENVAAKAKAELDAWAIGVIHKLGKNALDKMNEEPKQLDE